MSQFAQLFVEAQHSIITGRDSEILDLRFGFQGTDSQTLEEVGNVYGITRERARQLVDRALRKIRSRGHRELKKNNTYDPCAQLLLYLRRTIGDDEKNYIEAIASFIETELNYLPLQSHSVPLITYLFFGSNAEVKKWRYDVSKFISAKRKNLRREKRQIIKLEKLLTDVIWPPETKTWDASIFRNHVPQRQSANNSSASGTYFSEKLQRKVGYESSIEYDYFLKLEALDQIVYYLEQPFRVTYENYGQQLSYYPDVFFLLQDGRGVVVEIKPIFKMGLQDNLTKWSALREYCAGKGMGMIVSDGRESIQQIQKYAVRSIVLQSITSHLEREPLSWQQYKIIREQYQIPIREFIALVLRHRLKWQLAPFKLTI